MSDLKSYGLSAKAMKAWGCSEAGEVAALAHIAAAADRATLRKALPRSWRDLPKSDLSALGVTGAAAKALAPEAASNPEPEATEGEG